MASNLIPLNPSEYLSVRGLTEETCKFWKYMSNQDQHVATYWKDGVPVAQKVRKAYKGFHVNGDFTDAGLYGDHLWAPHPKKGIIICEGEIDAMTVSQLQNNEWPVVSVPNGAGGAVNAIKKNLEYLEGFKHVIFMFDMDEPGIEAAKACAEILPIGKAKIASLPLKDPNEMLKANRGAEVIKAMWDAKPWSPDGILTGEAIWEAMIEDDDEDTIPYPWDGMNRATSGGMRTGCLYLWSSGTGMGKTTTLGELVHDLAVSQRIKVAYISLEEIGKQATNRLLSITLNQPLQVLKGAERVALIKENRESVSAFENNVAVWDHWGMKEDDSLITKIRYMVKGMDCNVVVLDHISLVMSAMGSTNERVVLDKLMTDLRTLVSETGCCMHVVSHLSRGSKDSATPEDGGSFGLSNLRGSHSLGQLADGVFGIMRKGENIAIHSIKNLRINGFKGEMCELVYNEETGRLKELGVFA